MVELEAARIGIALAGTIAATYYDLTHNRTVPDWLTFGMIGFGILANLVAFGLDVSMWAEVAVPALIVVGIGYPLYRMGQIGGADVLVFAAIALLVPYAPQGLLAQQEPLVKIPFIVSIFLVSGVLFGVVTFARFAVPALRALKSGEVRLGTVQIIYVAAMVACAIALGWLANRNGIAPAFMAVAMLSILFAIFFYIFKGFIARKFLIQEVGVEGIDEEDILAVEEMDSKVVKKYGLQKLLTGKEIEKLRALPIKKFPVYKNMPAFMPYVLCALVLGILYGDVVSLILGLSVSVPLATAY